MPSYLLTTNTINTPTRRAHMARGQNLTALTGATGLNHNQQQEHISYQ